MIFRADNLDDEPRVTLICINGDRITLDTKTLGAFLLSSPFLIVLSVLVTIKALFATKFYGFELSEMERFVVWPLYHTTVTVVWYLEFWLIAIYAKRVKRSLLVVTTGVYVLPYVLAIALQHKIIDLLTGTHMEWTDSHLSLLLIELLIALAFEYFVANWVWPAAAEYFAENEHRRPAPKSGTYEVELGDVLQIGLRALIRGKSR